MNQELRKAEKRDGCLGTLGEDQHQKRASWAAQRGSDVHRAKSWNFKGGWNRYWELAIVRDQRSHMSHSPTKGISARSKNVQRASRAWSNDSNDQAVPPHLYFNLLPFHGIGLAKHAVFPRASNKAGPGTSTVEP